MKTCYIYLTVCLFRYLDHDDDSSSGSSFHSDEDDDSRDKEDKLKPDRYKEVALPCYLNRQAGFVFHNVYLSLLCC